MIAELLWQEALVPLWLMAQSSFDITQLQNNPQMMGMLQTLLNSVQSGIGNSNGQSSGSAGKTATRVESEPKNADGQGGTGLQGSESGSLDSDGAESNDDDDLSDTNLNEHTDDKEKEKKKASKAKTQTRKKANSKVSGGKTKKGNDEGEEKGGRSGLRKRKHEEDAIADETQVVDDSAQSQRVVEQNHRTTRSSVDSQAVEETATAKSGIMKRRGRPPGSTNSKAKTVTGNEGTPVPDESKGFPFMSVTPSVMIDHHSFYLLCQRVESVSARLDDLIGKVDMVLKRPSLSPPPMAQYGGYQAAHHAHHGAHHMAPSGTQASGLGYHGVTSSSFVAPGLNTHVQQ